MDQKTLGAQRRMSPAENCGARPTSCGTPLTVPSERKKRPTTRPAISREKLSDLTFSRIPAEIFFSEAQASSGGRREWWNRRRHR